MKVHLFRGIEKSFPRTTTTTTTNKPFLRPRQRSLAIKNPVQNFAPLNYGETSRIGDKDVKTSQIGDAAEDGIIF